VGGRVNQPSGVEAYYGPQENAPEQNGQSSESQQQNSKHDHRNVVEFSDPHMKPVFGQVRDVARQGRTVVVHGLAHQGPTHVRPPLAIARGVGIAFAIGVLVMNAMGRHAEYGAAFEGESATEGEKVLDPLGSLISAMRQQPVITHADSQAA